MFVASLPPTDYPKPCPGLFQDGAGHGMHLCGQFICGGLRPVACLLLVPPEINPGLHPVDVMGFPPNSDKFLLKWYDESNISSEVS